MSSLKRCDPPPSLPVWPVVLVSAATLAATDHSTCCPQGVTHKPLEVDVSGHGTRACVSVLLHNSECGSALCCRTRGPSTLRRPSSWSSTWTGQRWTWTWRSPAARRCTAPSQTTGRPSNREPPSCSCRCLILAFPSISTWERLPYPSTSRMGLAECQTRFHCTALLLPMHLQMRTAAVPNVAQRNV